MTTKEKFETGNYILLRRYLISDGYYIENDPKDFDIVCPDILINKKHKHILDAYLFDNDVEIEYRNPNDFKHIWKCDDFIGNYNESYTYRILNNEKFVSLDGEYKELDKLKEYTKLKTKQEYITVPNSKVKFLKPPFKCEILKEIKDHNEKSYFIGYSEDVRKDISYPYAKTWTEDGKCWSDDDLNLEDFNLIPYKQPWHENENNFPCVLFSNDTGMFIINRMCDFIEGFANENKYRFATNEEIDSLKTKKKTYVKCSACLSDIECDIDLKDYLERERVVCDSCVEKQFKYNQSLGK